MWEFDAALFKVVFEAHKFIKGFLDFTGSFSWLTSPINPISFPFVIGNFPPPQDVRKYLQIREREKDKQTEI